MSDVSRLDRHSIAAVGSMVWDALAATLDAEVSRPPARVVARLTGVDSKRLLDPPFPETGSEIPGFRVVLAVPGKRLRLEGEHRFSRHALDFLLVTNSGGTVLSATTFADFPGTAGLLYKRLLLRTRAHSFVVKRLLRAIRRRAERVPARGDRSAGEAR